MRILRAIGRWMANGSTALLAGGLTVRMTVGDSIPGISTIFYATPWSVLCGLALVPTILWLRRKRRLPATGFAIVALLCGIAWVRSSFRSTPARPAQFRVAYWNVGRPMKGLDSTLAKVGEIPADVFGIGESRKTGTQMQPEWVTHFAPKSVLSLRRGMILATPQPATQLHDGYLNDRGQYSFTKTTIQGREVFILMADFDAIVSLSRKPAFDRLLQILDEIGDVPLIVMGDFNTPSDSIYFQPLRAKMRDVYETAGDGYSQTWPMPFPVLDLDHIWVSHHFDVVRAEHITSFLSDHRAVAADLNFR